MMTAGIVSPRIHSDRPQKRAGFGRKLQRLHTRDLDNFGRADKNLDAKVVTHRYMGVVFTTGHPFLAHIFLLDHAVSAQC
jgi:hypothetical protein